MPTTVLVVNEDAERLCLDLRREQPGYAFRAAKTADEALAQAAEAEVVVAYPSDVTASLVASMPKLRWIHVLSAGYEQIIALDNLPPDVALSNSRGVHGSQMAELAILMMMALSRRLPDMLSHQRQTVWERRRQPTLIDKTVCIIGLGAIAEALADRLRPFGVRLTGVSDGRRKMPGFLQVFGREHLADAAAVADFVVVLVPHTPETHHLVNDKVFAAMKSSAFVINLSRGSCVDEPALIRHLRSGSIAGAGLDVFESEPLPGDSPLWSMPNVIVTPHIGGYSDILHEQTVPVILANLSAYSESGPQGLLNRIERA